MEVGDAGARVRHLCHNTEPMAAVVSAAAMPDVVASPGLAMTPSWPGSMRVALVPGEGLEPTLCFQNRILSPARLPIPPSRRR